MIEMRSLIVIVLVFYLIGCNSKPTFSDARNKIENLENLVTDYNFCMYEKEGLIMQQKMYKSVKNLDNQVLCDYFSNKGVKRKKTIAQIVCRFYCREREYYGRPLSSLTDSQFLELLDQCMTEIIRQNKEIHTIISDKQGNIIYEEN